MPIILAAFKLVPIRSAGSGKSSFAWLETGISIRHADTVDVKFIIWTDGEERQERVLALRHPTCWR